MKRVMAESAAEKFLSKKLNVAKSQLVKKFEDIKLSPPFYLKIISNDALHKSNIGAVKKVSNKSEIASSFNELISIAKKNKLRLEGILVQEEVKGHEFILGIKKDNVFGHIVLLGTGGILTELYEDVAMRKCPISKSDAEEMIEELKTRKLFEGFRGIKINKKELVDSLVKLSSIPKNHPNIEELDINPYILNEKQGVVADARIVFSK